MFPNQSNLQKTNKCIENFEAERKEKSEINPGRS